MNRVWQLRGTAVANMAPDGIARTYLKNFNWNDGRRLTDESRLVHLVCDQALKHAGVKRSGLGNKVGIALAGCYGGLASYERFRTSLNTNGDLQPLAFSMSLPGVPVSVLSLYYGITGPVTSIAAEVEEIGLGGVKALEAGMNFIDSGWCDLVIVGSYYAPSITSCYCGAPASATVALAVITIDEEKDNSDTTLFRLTTNNQSKITNQETTDSWWQLLTIPKAPNTSSYTLPLGKYIATVWRRG